MCLQMFEIVQYSNFSQSGDTQKNNLLWIKDRKTVSSALWLPLSLVARYLPSIVVLSLVRSDIQGRLSSAYYVTAQFTTSSIYFNSSLNPILCCWKIREVRKAVKMRIRQLCCSSSLRTAVQSMFSLSTDSLVLFERNIYIFHLTVVR